MLGVIWWMYGGYAWLTNAVRADRLSRGGSCCSAGWRAYFVLALAIPTRSPAPARRSASPTRPWSSSTRRSSRAPRRELAACATSCASHRSTSRSRGAGAGRRHRGRHGAVRALVGGAAARVATPKLVSASRASTVGSEHFVERHGLVVLIAIGESVVAVGVGAHALPVDSTLARPSPCSGSRSRPASGGRTSAATTSVPSARCATHPPSGAAGAGARSASATATCRSCSASWPSRPRSTMRPRIRSTRCRRRGPSCSPAASRSSSSAMRSSAPRCTSAAGAGASYAPRRPSRRFRSAPPSQPQRSRSARRGARRVLRDRTRGSAG